MTYTNKQKADVLRKAAELIRDGTNDWACIAVAFATPKSRCLLDELIKYLHPFWNHDNEEALLSTSLAAHLNIEYHVKMRPFFRVAREKMLLAAADAMEKGLEP